MAGIIHGNKKKILQSLTLRVIYDRKLDLVCYLEIRLKVKVLYKQKKLMAMFSPQIHFFKFKFNSKMITQNLEMFIKYLYRGIIDFLNIFLLF